MSEAAPVEEAEGAGRLVQGAETEPAFGDLVALVGGEVVGCDFVERLADMGRQLLVDAVEHPGVGLHGPRAAACCEQRVGEQFLALSFVHDSSLSNESTCEKLGPGRCAATRGDAIHPPPRSGFGSIGRCT